MHLCVQARVMAVAGVHLWPAGKVSPASGLSAEASGRTACTGKGARVAARSTHAGRQRSPHAACATLYAGLRPFRPSSSCTFYHRSSGNKHSFHGPALLHGHRLNQSDAHICHPLTAPHNSVREQQTSGTLRHPPRHYVHQFLKSLTQPLGAAL